MSQNNSTSDKEEETVSFPEKPLTPEALAAMLGKTNQDARRIIEARNQRVHVAYPSRTRTEEGWDGIDEDSYEPYINQPIEIDAAPRFHLGRVLTRVEKLVVVFAGTITLFQLFTQFPLPAQISGAATLTALADLGFQQVKSESNPAELSTERAPGEFGASNLEEDDG